MKKISTNLAKVVKCLNDQQFHDGTSIGQQLYISRAAVWKVIEKLKNYGIEITSIKGKGYRLINPLILLDATTINHQLQTKAVKINCFAEIDSTNDYLKTSANQNQKRQVCIAEKQTHGKARFQRSWHSPFGQNIYLSMGYAFKKDVSELAGLSLVTGLAICKAIEASCDLPKPPLIKWPNDILYDQQKLAGTLIEIQAETNGFSQAIIGIGLNVNMDHDNERKINQNWTSIKRINQRYNDRNKICAALIDQLSYYLERFEQKGLSDFLTEWLTRDCLFNQPVRLKSTGNTHQGEGLGINGQGHLLIKLANGSQKAFSSGDTTLLK